VPSGVAQRCELAIIDQVVERGTRAGHGFEPETRDRFAYTVSTPYLSRLPGSSCYTEPPHYEYKPA
jgi:hypothetical protein